MSVFLSYSLLKTGISLAKAIDLRHSSVRTLFFFFIELFKFRLYSFEQLLLYVRKVTPSSEIRQSSAFSSTRLQQCADIAIA